ncbi:MAG: hypothetical protein KHX56_09495 [Clostridiales bacterium]|nr:hypothetical protein [Clostridiales bacterium]
MKLKIACGDRIFALLFHFLTVSAASAPTWLNFYEAGLSSNVYFFTYVQINANMVTVQAANNGAV